METIKQLAIPVKQKRDEITTLRKQLEQVRIEAQFPEPAKRTVERVPVNFGAVALRQGQEPGTAQTYEERTIEAGASTDRLEVLKEQRHKELGLAHLENRSAETSELDAAITSIEGSRAALSLLEQRIVQAQTELAGHEKSLAEACYAFGREKLNEAQTKYWAALDMVAESLPYISGASQLMNIFSEKTGRGWWDYAAPFYGAPVRLGPDGNFYQVDWARHTPLESRKQAYMDLLAELQSAGVTV